jgi:hypothetical protein
VTSLAPSRYQITFTASEETCEKLQLAQDLLRHAIPSGDLPALFDRALTALLKDLAREKFAATEHPRASARTANGTRHIPAEVKRAVWVRDLGRCAFVSKDGRRCSERAFLEFHHLIPYAVGGPATVDNLALRCRSHNAHEADLYYEPRASEDVVQEPRAPYAVSSLPQLVPDRVDSSLLNFDQPPRIRDAKRGSVLDVRVAERVSESTKRQSAGRS